MAGAKIRRMFCATCQKNRPKLPPADPRYCSEKCSRSEEKPSSKSPPGKQSAGADTRSIMRELLNKTQVKRDS